MKHEYVSAGLLVLALAACSAQEHSVEFEPSNWYGKELTNRGFDWASGAANQYWFNWPTSESCFLRLNLTALPKERIEGDDWTDLQVYVAVFEFEPEERCEQN